MKQFLLIIFITLYTGFSASAQFAENNSLYLGFGPTVGKVIGFGVSPYVNFNSKNMAYGLDLQVLIGILQPSRQSKSRY
ncbi:hypothetical protein [Algoriphagus sp.]|uniref:hypothetical protein n=1 Tax=Algoriphagus sp. TaxID=1872435 RepID=UPI0027217D18|nr:hypothetical protein [Algoriphagus sp.]MDO8966156.1 hypothetical protein [Algoriphagus sp.]MDP3200932.1 hypothetical protein [Algoriphagus sp.]